MTLLKVAHRDYVCPICKAESSHSTNHEGEIYSGCKKCGGSVLYFKQDSRQYSPMFILKRYRFNVENPQESSEYANLINNIAGKCFEVHVQPSSKFFDHLEDNAVISVHEAEQFDNQFVTNRGRLHQWFEAIYPNRQIKEGYYLEKIAA